MEGKKLRGITIEIEADTTELDETIEKANQLVQLLKEAQNIINSLPSCNNYVSIEEVNRRSAIQEILQEEQNQRTSEKAQESLDQLLSGRKTINQIRQEYGLDLIDGNDANKFLVRE